MQEDGTRSTPERSREAATVPFREHGLAGTSVRRIAAEACADPSLVIRHVGSKELLFRETTRVEAQHRPLFDAPLEELGRRTVRLLLEFSDELLQRQIQNRSEPALVERTALRVRQPGANRSASGARRGHVDVLSAVGPSGHDTMRSLS